MFRLSIAKYNSPVGIHFISIAAITIASSPSRLPPSAVLPLPMTTAESTGGHVRCVRSSAPPQFPRACRLATDLSSVSRSEVSAPLYVWPVAQLQLGSGGSNTGCSASKTRLYVTRVVQNVSAPRYIIRIIFIYKSRVCCLGRLTPYLYYT